MVITTKSGHKIEIDDNDFEKVEGFLWRPYTRYARAYEAGVAKGAGRYVYMHRLLTNAPAGTEVDHIDGNGLNNKRSNLRVGTRSQNQHNRRRHQPQKPDTGVYWHKTRKKWCARRYHDGKTYWIGSYETKEAALIACRVK